MSSDCWATVFKACGHEFSFFDVGARDGIEQPWKTYEQLLSITAFEPDKEESEKLSNYLRVIDKALAESECTRELRLLKSRGCSSLLAPNYDFLQCFPESERFGVEKTETQMCTSLDKLKEEGKIESIDFIKIDTQGTEKYILEGGAEALRQCVGIQVEVEFHQMYQGQPLFADVDQFIRTSLGLDLQDLKKAYWKYKTEAQAKTSKGTLIFGDALYFRRPDRVAEWLESLPEEIRFRKAVNLVFMGYIYGYHDYCFKLLEIEVVRQLLYSHLDLLTKAVLAGNGNLAWYLPERLRSALGHRFLVLGNFFRPSYRNWATSGEGLGNKKKLGFFTSR
ncbi:MAG: FkbM family methyltransferase [Pseudohongiella sp.]|nr:FkbM family methyltransferase [Pseudohongiella sp.]